MHAFMYILESVSARNLNQSTFSLTERQASPVRVFSELYAGIQAQKYCGYFGIPGCQNRQIMLLNSEPDDRLNCPRTC